jgi:hypothetical protein
MNSHTVSLLQGTRRKSRIVGSILCASLILASPPARLAAESYFPFADFRVIDATGKYYVVVQRTGGPRHRGEWGPVELTIAQQKPGSSRVQPGRAKVVRVEGAGDEYQMADADKVAVRPDDTVHGCIGLDNPSSTILVSNTGLGVVLLDRYGHNYTLVAGKDPAVKIVSLKGQLLHSIKLESLFSSEEILRFRPTLSGSRFWLLRAWIDEERQELVIVGRDNEQAEPDPIAVVKLATGVVRRGNAEDIMRAVATKKPDALAAALDVAIRRSLKGVKPQLPGILQNEALPIEARLRAAVFLGSMGDKSGAELLASTTRQVSKQLLQHPDWQDIENERLFDIYYYAVRHLPDLLGERALPILREVARRQGYPTVPTYDAFCRLGAKSVPHLIEMLEDDNDPQGQVFAADVLCRIKPDTEVAVSSLAKALRSPAQSTSGLALRQVAASALGEIGPPAKSALPALSILVHDADEDVRKAAADAIAKINR